MPNSSFGLNQKTAHPQYGDLKVNEPVAPSWVLSPNPTNHVVPLTVLKRRLVNAIRKYHTFQVRTIADVPLEWVEHADALFKEIENKRWKDGVILTDDDKQQVESLREILYWCFYHLGRADWSRYSLPRSPFNM